MNRRLVCSLAHVTFLLAVLFPVVGFATPLQWDAAGVPLRQGAGIGAYSVAQNAQDQTLVVWCDLRSGSDDIYAQLISPSGVPQWTDGGRVVVAHPAEQVNPVAVAVDDGWIVFWIDHRHGCGSNVDPGWGDIYAQKLSATGQPLWPAEDGDGVPVDINTATQVMHSEPLVAVADGNGGALVAWTGYVGWDLAILAQHVSGGGQVLWAAPLAVADSMRVCEFSVAGAGDAAGNLFLCWTEWSQNWRRLRVAKITPDGQRAWGGSGRLVSVGAVSPLHRPQLCPDGEGGCYIDWVHTDSGSDVRVQRLNSEGANLWTAGGISVYSLPSAATDLALALSRTGATLDGCLLSWTTRPGLPDYTEVRVQKVSPAGAIQWAPGAVCVADYPCGGEGDHRRAQPRVVSDQAGGVVCMWRDALFGEVLDGDLYASRVNADGVKVWVGGCTPVRTGPAAQTSILPVAAPNGTYAFWVDIASESTTLRYQLLDPATGDPLLAPEGVALHDGICAAAEHPRILRLSAGRYVVVWEDTRTWTDREIYYQFFDQNGVAESPANGRPLGRSHTFFGPMRQYEAALCTDGSGGFFAAYLEICESPGSGVARVRLGHVNTAGEVVCASMPVHHDTLTEGDEPPRLLPDGQGGCYVAWTGYDHFYVRKIWVQRLNADGLPLWNQPRQLIVPPGGEHEMAGVVAGPDGSCVIVSLERVWPNGYVAGTCVRLDGSQAWRTAITNTEGRRESVRVLSDGAGGFFAVWSDNQSAAPFNLYAQHVSATGLALWAENGVGVMSNPGCDPWEVCLAQNRRGYLFVTKVITCSGDNQIRMQKLDPSGERTWDDTGRLVGTVGYDSQHYALVPDAGDGVFVCWSGVRELRPHIYGMHLDSAGAVVADPYWSAAGSLISTSWDAQREPVVCADGAGGWIVAYTDYKGIEEVVEPPQIYAQRIWDGFMASPEAPASLPHEFALHQNYPNPFNPVTVIAFDLPRDGRATLEVFDILGRRVMTIVDGVMSAGEHRVMLDAATLPSGAYVYRLQAAEFTHSRKMLLLK